MSFCSQAFDQTSSLPVAPVIDATMKGQNADSISHTGFLLRYLAVEGYSHCAVRSDVSSIEDRG